MRVVCIMSTCTQPENKEVSLVTFTQVQCFAQATVMIDDVTKHYDKKVTG